MQTDNIINLDLFLERCKKFNLKITPQRIFIYKVVSHSHQHPDTTEVYEMVKKEFPTISFDTVHRTLLTLSEIKLINIVEGSEGSKRFDPDITNHHHLHCEKCGKIIDFVHEEYDRLDVPNRLTREFKVTRKRVVINGICKVCQKKNKK